MSKKKKQPEPIGSPGTTNPLSQHHNIDDFVPGYYPHQLCLVGAMCSDCRNNLKPTNKTPK